MFALRLNRPMDSFPAPGAWSAVLMFQVPRAPLCQNELPNGFLSPVSLRLTCARWRLPTPI